MTPININYIVNKDTTDFNNNSIIKKGTIIKGTFSGMMPNGEIRITTDKGEIINYKDLQEQSNVNNAISIGKEPAPPTKSGDAFFPKLAGAYNKNLIIAVVLVAGYFAYKKFKK